MRLTIANRKAIEYACMHFHYAKAVPVNTLGYNVYNDADEWCGVILYGTGANNNIAASFGLPQGGGIGISASCAEWQTGTHEPSSCSEFKIAA